ncbi:MAG: type VI secretion system tip protein TssI/VgrG [Myxococcota bacterium]|nr:type VI secretion system tip protein TssI/VgrG [Myxococcota bacterium]
MERLEFDTMAPSVEPGSLTLLRLRGREALCRPYAYELTLETEADGGLAPEALDELLRFPCRVAFGREGGTEIHGILRAIEVPSAHEPSPVRYRAHLVPKLWALSQARRSRVFQDLDVVGIVTAVLEELGLEAETHFGFEVSKTYPTSEYTVQYQESDLDFVHRLLEHYGLFYFFAQGPDGEQVVFSDDSRTARPLEGAELLSFGAVERSEEAGVMELGRVLTPQPAAVVLRDYNWRTPSIALQSEAKVDEATGRGFHNEYGLHFKDPSAGAALAAVRSEELMAARDVYEGRCRVAGLAPGHRVEVTGHPLLGFDQEYLITEVEQEVDGGATQDTGNILHEKTFRAIPFTTPYRPPRRTPKPKIEGIMHARVDGEVPGTAAPIDQYGRYKVLFPFDLVGVPGGRASRWVRLAQPSSGAGYGIHFPLHIGAEVAVSHLDGDPDRPIIMASPPNAETVTPVNDRNATQSEIVTKTGIRMTWDDDC